jgi:predicted RNase H-like HicB family nuclease
MPGCYTEGDTLDEAKAMVVDAAECWLGGRLQDEIEYVIDPLPR